MAMGGTEPGLESSWFADTDLVVCMDRGHQQTLLSLARKKAGDDRFGDRLVMLRGFDPRSAARSTFPTPITAMPSTSRPVSRWWRPGAGVWWPTWPNGSGAGRWPRTVRDPAAAGGPAKAKVSRRRVDPP